MKKNLGILVMIAMMATATAQESVTPVIAGYGKVKIFKDTKEQFDPGQHYNLLFDLKSDKERDGVNEGLWKIARMMNLLGASGVPAENFNIVAAIHGPATFFTLNNVKYKEKFDKDNPNLELLRFLNEKGAKLYVCAQATDALNIAENDMVDDVETALSALSVLANYQLRGYVVIP